MRYYRLAEGATVRSGGEWPYEVDICFDGVSRPVGLSEGKCHGAAGGDFTAAQALDPVWDEHFELAGGTWLRPYLARMAAGEPVTAEEVVGRYVALHGRQPETWVLRWLPGGGGWWADREESRETSLAGGANSGRLTSAGPGSPLLRAR